eukprot:TRINITY_DN27026_c0_g1_i1.p1 TRINITY_DN27026_c0_g1~~TRINITY_DN27026_c0_g1_i1.p1  ORF type:complete len:290 (-),score=25.16 TRINITY_DN27026_c0_g1_i1:206-1042(-)
MAVNDGEELKWEMQIHSADGTPGQLVVTMKLPAIGPKRAPRPPPARLTNPPTRAKKPCACKCCSGGMDGQIPRTSRCYRNSVYPHTVEPPKIVRNPREVEDTVHRLYPQPPPKDAEQEQSPKKKRHNPAHMRMVANSVQRLHYEALQHQHDHAAYLGKVYCPTIPKSQLVSLNEDEIDSSVDRLYNITMREREQRKKELDDKYILPIQRAKMSKKQEGDHIKRLYTDSRQHFQETMGKLKEQYLKVAPRKKHSEERWQLLVDRLTTQPAFRAFTPEYH